MDVGMDDLPRGILASILLKLPGMSVLRSRAVSKFWMEIIDDPSFRRSFEAEEFMVLGYSKKHNKAPTIYLMTSDGCSVKAKKMASPEELHDYTFKNCCNGLFYFDKYDSSGKLQSSVFNPFTREVLKLPEPPRWSRYNRILRALGFDHSTSTFKLVELFFVDMETRSVGAATFNFKTQCWARCKAARHHSFQIVPDLPSYPVHATDTGTIYWHTGDNCPFNPQSDLPKRWPNTSYGQEILSFDVAKEEFRSSWFPKRVYSMHITEIDGRLVVCSYGVKYINMYELVDYQSHNWVRKYRVPKPSPQTSVDLSSFAKKKLLVAYPQGKDGNGTKRFYWYDLEDSGRTSLVEGTRIGEGRFDPPITVYCVKLNLIPLTQL